MTYLLDTHVWLWRLGDPDRVQEDTAATLDAAVDGIRLSPATIWETMILLRKGRLTVDAPPSEWILDAVRRTQFRSLPITVSIALRSESLADFETADPADRFIVATALEHGLTLVTADAAMLAYEPLDTLAA